MTLPTIERDYPVASTSAFGRVFFAGGNTLYYSPVIEDLDDIGKCYQANDPTSDTISDLLDSDGGILRIQDVTEIIDIISFRSGIIVFTDQGIWYVRGSDAVFKATSYQSSKVSKEILKNKGAALEVESSLLFCAEAGIYVIDANEYDNISISNITDETVQTKYKEIFDSGITSIGYNPRDKTIWIQGVDDILVYSMKSLGWYPQKVPEAAEEYISSILYWDSSLKFFNTRTSSKTFTYGWATLSDNTFKDFDEDQVAYITSGWETLGKFSHKKASTYGTFMFKKTETEITGYNDGYEFDSPSGCLMQARWDFDSSDAYGKWGRSVQLYNPMKRGFIPTSTYPYTFDTGESIISKKVKIRGNGKAVQFHFEAEPEKDLQLLGYSIEYSMRGRQ